MTCLRILLLGLLFAFFTAPSGKAADFVSTGEVWRYLKGTAEASSPDGTAWRQTAFDDSGWLSGPATFWYGDVFDGTQITV